MLFRNCLLEIETPLLLFDIWVVTFPSVHSVNFYACNVGLLQVIADFMQTI